ncbi:hypothetical protein RDV84_02800 [Lysobacter yananisis]|uniref:Uncharacterized protein n=1 Tax=Lysobacter yananisis TaxID=1003114 RepID=A0ABY9PD74_9GAMM|nr:hypothetical protein [Lysobacter yananisis]WMT03792.1 hypothetical protein RDV84_02800 [Lysobacter yananisis]
MSHAHRFDESTWPFDSPINTHSFTTRQVLDGGLPILEVYHDHDGDWQFLCGTTQDTADGRLVCLGCMIDRDAALLQLADLPVGWSAVRESTGHAWLRQPDEYDEDA